MPARSLLVLTCMDARLEPLALLGLRVGDAHVVRNAGGRARDALRSVAVSCAMFGTRAILVVHHTGCGMHGLTSETVRDRLRVRGAAAAAEADFLPFASLEDSVRADVAELRGSALIPPDVAILGFTYDVGTGRLAPVGPASSESP